MFNFFKTARHWIVLTVAVAAVACGQEQPSLPIEPAPPRPATSTTAAVEVEAVEVPSATPPTTATAPAAVDVETPGEPVADPVEATPEADDSSEDLVEDDAVALNTWIDETTTTAAAPAHTTTTTTTTEPPATTTTVAATTTTTTVAATTTTEPAATTTTAAPATTTTTEPPAATTTTSEPAATTTTAAPTTTTTAAVVTAGGKVVPPIPRPGDPDVPEVNTGRVRPVHVDLSWFPEMKNVITYEEWNRVDEENTPTWGRRESPEVACPPRNWWSYPLTIQVGTVLANTPRGADCFSPVPQSYVVTRMYPLPVCQGEDDTRNCTYSNVYANAGYDYWQIVVCGYTFDGSLYDWGISYRTNGIRLEDGRFRVITNSLYTPRECDR